MKIMIWTLILLAMASFWGAFFSEWNPMAQMGSLFILGCAFALIIMALIPDKNVKSKN